MKDHYKVPVGPHRPMRRRLPVHQARDAYRNKQTANNKSFATKRVIDIWLDLKAIIITLSREIKRCRKKMSFRGDAPCFTGYRRFIEALAPPYGEMHQGPWGRLG